MSFKNIFVVLFLIAILPVSLYTYYKFDEFNKEAEAQGEFLSPLPSTLTEGFAKVLGDQTAWQPINVSKTNEELKSNLASSAKAALLYDLTTNSMLIDKNIKEKLPMASLTKIMTAIIALENMNLSQKIRVTKEAAEIGENAMSLTEGEELTLEELLYGLILPSGNDAAEAIAASSIFGRDGFIFQMNKKAEDLGLTHTHFTNSTGLEGDGDQYTTAYDLLVMTRYALTNPTFAKIVGTVEYEIPSTSTHKYFYLYNETNLLTSYPGVKGVKTGFTNEAGLCLVTYLDYEGHKIIGVLLNSQNRRQEMRDMLDFGLKSLGVNPPHHD